MVVLTMNVGTVWMNGKTYPGYQMGVTPDIKMNNGWIHVIPSSYSPKFLKDSAIFCFEDTQELYELMLEWLEKAHVLQDYNSANTSLVKERKYQKIATKLSKERTKKARFNNVYKATEGYLAKLEMHNFRSDDPDLLKQMKDKKKCPRGPFIHSSLAYHDIFYGPPNPTTDDILYLNNGTMLADLSNPGPPYLPGTNWADIIKSAHVSSGCLRLFKATNYGGIFLFLWGPNADYPDLSQFGFLDAANSLQQSP